ncbi:hypothetical protein TrRE_jg214, partial [Triparma retinervis]
MRNVANSSLRATRGDDNTYDDAGNIEEDTRMFNLHSVSARNTARVPHNPAIYGWLPKATLDHLPDATTSYGISEPMQPYRRTMRTDPNTRLPFFRNETMYTDTFFPRTGENGDHIRGTEALPEMVQLFTTKQSKLMHVVPITDKSAESICSGVEAFIQTYGRPGKIVGDFAMENRS